MAKIRHLEQSRQLAAVVAQTPATLETATAQTAGPEAVEAHSVLGPRLAAQALQGKEITAALMPRKLRRLFRPVAVAALALLVKMLQGLL